MSLTIARADLARLLANTVRVVESRNTIPILAMVKLEAGRGMIAATATDLDIEIASSIECEGDLSVCVSASLLESIVKKLPASAEIRLDDEGDLVARSGRSRFALQTLPVADYPKISAGKFGISFKADLAALFAPVSFAISTEETRFYLNGIYIHADGDKLTAVATDGHRLSRNLVDLPEGADAIPGVILPRKLVGLVPKGEVGIEVSDTKIRITAGETVITSKLIDGTFPDYKRILPTDNENIIEFDGAEMRQAAERVSLVSSERGRAIKLSFASGQAVLTVNNPSAGSGTEEVGVSYDGPPIDIGFNSAYLGELVGTLPSGPVRLALRDGGSPALFTSPHAYGLLMVLMPMRVG